ncbi:hypothetical protein [Paraburkholderia ultramafica]|uniref:hypothetical protein n=1 Tax=Paraburkholderia ultramafica TaxID=1544867 RepID=UPI001FEC0D18|nr:hypothetical protein [Paraburkholderia ultramafica]
MRSERRRRAHRTGRRADYFSGIRRSQEGTGRFHTFPTKTNCYDGACEYENPQKKTDDLARNIIEQIADKWTILVIDMLGTHGEMRFSRLREVPIAWRIPKDEIYVDRSSLSRQQSREILPIIARSLRATIGTFDASSFCGAAVPDRISRRSVGVRH